MEIRSISPRRVTGSYSGGKWCRKEGALQKDEDHLLGIEGGGEK